MVLYINACTREESRTNELAEHLISKFIYAPTEVVLRELDLKPLNEDRLKQRSISTIKGDFSSSIFDQAKLLKEADTLIIAAPFYDLSFSSLLKVYIENICVQGLTFIYGEDGIPRSLLKLKKVFYVTTSGGKITNDEFGWGYLKAVFSQFFDVKEFQLIKAECLDIIGFNEIKILKEAKKEIDLIKL